MPSEKRKFGDVGERLAEDFLKKRNYQILERNWRRPCGELDIVAKKRGVIIFVEVKTGETEAGFMPEENLTKGKQAKLIRIAETYLAELEYPLDTLWQIDVIAIRIGGRKDPPEIMHFENSVWRN